MLNLTVEVRGVRVVVGDLGSFCNLVQHPVNNERQEGAGNGNDNVVKPKSPSSFGEVRPREEVLAEKGHDWKKIDEHLESMKIKEAVEKKESFGKRGFGSGNGRVLEEEFVKEVLSETPIAKRNQVPILKPESDTLLPPLQNPDDKIESKNQHPIPNPIIINKKEGEVSEVVSQLSEEPCSISGSFSIATTVTEKRKEEVTSKRSIREGTTTMMKNHKWNSNRSPSRKRSVEEEGARVGIGE
ncbi:Eukaryotic translation initiation factor [Arachis hypogaea]|nr:Eukaryotic translation initiation factor [Arachis hypogaea]